MQLFSVTIHSKDNPEGVDVMAIWDDRRRARQHARTLCRDTVAALNGTGKHIPPKFFAYIQQRMGTGLFSFEERLNMEGTGVGGAQDWFDLMRDGEFVRSCYVVVGRHYLNNVLSDDERSKVAREIKREEGVDLEDALEMAAGDYGLTSHLIMLTPDGIDRSKPLRIGGNYQD